jgi:hypothetical protein
MGRRNFLKRNLRLGGMRLPDSAFETRTFFQPAKEA